MTQLADTRRRILDAAERLFAEHGFDATATSKIAAVAAVPKGLLFYYFPAKADLLRSLVGERLDFGPINTSQLVEPGNPARSLMKLTDKLNEVLSASEVSRVIVWREQRTHPEVRHNLLQHRKRMLSVIERVLRESVLHPIAASRVKVAAQAWLAILTSRPLPGRADEPGADDGHENLAALAELICDGLSVSPRSAG